MNETVTEQVTRQLGEPGRDLAALAAAYVKAWAEVGVGVLKDAKNAHLGNEYATLEAHLNAIKAVFARNGLAILQAPGEVVEIGGHLALTIDSVVLHTSGQRITIRTHVPMVADKHGNVTAQIMGSAATYGCRYVLRGLAGLAATDDDGNAASTATPRKTVKEPDSGEGDALIAEIQAFAGTVEELEKTIKPRVKDMGLRSVNEAYLARRRALKEACLSG